VTSTVDDTHRASLVSWVESAQDSETEFPIQNLPYCVFRRSNRDDPPRVGIGIGNQVLDVAACARAGLLTAGAATAASACDSPSLNALMTLDSRDRRALRHAVSGLLRADSAGHRSAQARASDILVAIGDAELQLPVRIGDYTDFYASIHHATNVGSMFRPDNPLLPNYKWVPIGYHGRASSIVASGTIVQRPSGQLRDNADAPPKLGPTRRMDYELEVGAYVARGNTLGSPISIENAEEHIFGLTLVNDWSARDIQAWEYQPLGPFLAKSFATTVSPWVVDIDGLAPYRTSASHREPNDPAPLPYLSSEENEARGGIDITLDVYLASARMRSDHIRPMLVSHGSFTNMYWTIAQLLAHHTSNGCNLRPGDLLASGTVSGPTEESRGCLIERTWRGSQPLQLPTGETRACLEDGDEVLFRGYCEREGFARIGFGECRGVVLG
jgi:fumarylacetoacetase